jgi:hypothetical protein
MDLIEISWAGVEWIQLGQGRDKWWVFVNTVMNHRVSELCSNAYIIYILNYFIITTYSDTHFMQFVCTVYYVINCTVTFQMPLINNCNKTPSC